LSFGDWPRLSDSATLATLLTRRILTLALLASIPATASAQIEVDPRAPVVLLIITPPGVQTSTPSSAFLEVAGAQLEARTSLAIRSMEQAGVDRGAIDRCDPTQRFTCWVTAVDRPPHQGRFLISMIVHPAAAGHARLVPLLIDLAAARSYLATGDRQDSSWIERVEARIFADTIRGRPQTVDVRSRLALEGYFAQLFDERLRPVFERSGVWGALGSVIVESSDGGAPIAVDGRLIGLTQAGLTTLVDVKPGERSVRVGEVATVVSVTADAAVRIAPDGAPTHVARAATFWGGVASIAAGVAVGIAGGVVAQDDVASACLVRGGASSEDCESIGGPGSARESDPEPSLSFDGVNGGVPLVPLSASLIAAGVGWSVSAALLGDPDDVPWWGLAIGLIAGGAAFGVSAAIVR